MNKETLSESFPMSSGDGPNSYYKNSTGQKEIVDTAKELINKAVQDEFDFSQNSKTICIADFGCSTGPNTFIAMQNIIEAVQLKYQNTQQQQDYDSPLEFQVFFNDVTDNDFNTLFKNLPPSHKYFAAGVPGGFHNRLFPKSSLHFGYSSFALHWLTKVPEDVVDANSPAWNKDSIHSTGFVKEVAKAYLTQFESDIDSFLNARAQEIFNGGLMVVVLVVMPDGFVSSETSIGMSYDLLGSSLMDMAKLGLISNQKVEAFNLPVYHPTLKELETVVKRNGCFNVERVDTIPISLKVPSVQYFTSTFRAVLEELVKKHFGNELVDSVFEYFSQKLSTNYLTFIEKQKPNYLLIVLKRTVI